MPTAARLVGAIAFAIVGFFIFNAMLPEYGDDTVPRFLLPLCIGAGLWAGWVLCGKHAHSVVSGIGTGLTAGIAQGFWILLIMSFVRMIEQSLRRRYDGPMEAVVDVFTIMFDNGVMFGTTLMAITVLGGSVIAGMITGAIGKKYPR